MYCLHLTLIGELANAVSAVRWITSCISDPGPWANIHLHSSGAKFPSSPSLDSTSPVLSHHLRSYCSALLTVPLIRRGSSVCQLSIHIVTDPIRHVARCDFIFPSININWEIYHPLKHLSTFIQTVKNNDCCQIGLPKRPFSHYWLLSWDAITKQKNQPIEGLLAADYRTVLWNTWFWSVNSTTQQFDISQHGKIKSKYLNY